MAGMDRLTWRRSTGAGARVGGIQEIYDWFKDDDTEDTEEDESDSIQTEIRKIQARYSEAKRKQYALPVRKSDVDDYKAALAAQDSYYKNVFSKHVDSFGDEPMSSSRDAYWRPKFSKDREELDDLHDKVMSFKPWLSYADGGADGGEGGGGVETYGKGPAIPGVEGDPDDPEIPSDVKRVSEKYPGGDPSPPRPAVVAAGIGAAGTALLLGSVLLGGYLILGRRS